MDSLAASRNQLESLLNDIATTRSTLPSLLRAFQTPQLSSQELALLYSNRSKIASNSLKSLRDSLGAAEGVLERARVSEEKDSSGIVLGKERERRGDVMGLNELRIIFRVKSEEKVRKSSGKPPTRISNLQEMNEVLCGWEEIYPRVRIEPVVDQRAVKLVVRGLMKVSLHLYWDEEEMQVERIICCGLKENVRRPSGDMGTKLNGLNRFRIIVDRNIHCSARLRRVG